MPNTQIEIRIKNIQKKLNVPLNGVFDLTTCIKFIQVAKFKSPSVNTLVAYKKHIQKNLGFTGGDIDAIFGGNTLTRVEDLLSNQLPDIPAGSSLVVSTSSLDFILREEVSSEANYNLRYKFPTWPKGDSGITIGIGYDIGYVTSAQFENDWKSRLSPSDYNLLTTVVGKKGDSAKLALTNDIKRIVIPLQAAKEVFYLVSMPKYAKAVRAIYPGVEKLPPDAQGALLSLVYNRGASLVGERRLEMKNIIAHVASKNLSRIAREILNMKRLWTGIGLSGLLRRREKEADLVLNATYHLSFDKLAIV